MVVVSEFAADWPYSHPRPTPETNHHYHGMVRAFAAEYRLHPLDGFPRAEAQRWGIAHPSAVRYVRAMFSDAVSDGLASANPFSGLRSATRRAGAATSWCRPSWTSAAC
jgi:hypothetical protein